MPLLEYVLKGFECNPTAIEGMRGNVQKQFVGVLMTTRDQVEVNDNCFVLDYRLFSFMRKSAHGFEANLVWDQC